jgi:hypothetical protein
VTRHRVLIDIEFTVDEDRFKLAQLSDDASGVSDVTDAGVRDAVTSRLVLAEWAAHGLAPLRSIVTTRPQSADGNWARVDVLSDPGVVVP